MDPAERQTAERTLCALTDRSAAIGEKGFALDLRAEPEAWRRAISALGRGRAYLLIAERLCSRYELRYRKPFLFSESCVAFEIAYHAEAYFWALGLGGRRHASTLLFSREKLIAHCEVVDISTDDTASRKQRLMFSYAAGVRPRYRGTAEDPFAAKRRNAGGNGKG